MNNDGLKPSSILVNEQRQRQSHAKKRRFKKKVLVFSLFALAVAVSAIIYKNNTIDSVSQPNQQPAVKDSADEQKIQIYQASTFRFPVPKDWIALSKEEITRLNAQGGIREPKDKMVAIIYINSEKVQLNDLEKLLEDRQKDIAEFKKLSVKTMKFDGYETLEFIYEYKIDEQLTKQITYATPLGSQVYYLAFTAKADEFDNHANELKYITAGYQINPKPEQQ